MRNAIIVLMLLVRVVAAEPTEANNEDVSMGLAIATTAGGLLVTYSAARSSVPQLAAIGAIGLVIGPSAGHFYAGEWGHALGMSAIRTAALVATTVGVIESLSRIDDGPQPDHTRALDLAVIGATTYLVATLYDIYDSRAAARRANALTIAPTFGQSSGTGFVVGGRF